MRRESYLTRARRPAPRYTSTESASRSASNTALRRRRGPRRRPAAAAAGRSGRRCGRGRAPSRMSAPSSWPVPRTSSRASRGDVAARTRAGATKSSPTSNSRLGRDAQRDRPGVGVRVAVRDEHERGTADALDLELRLPARAPLDAASARPCRMNATSPGRAPSASRPSASSRRTASASKPMPAEKQKRRPLTRPSEIAPRAALVERRRRPPRGRDRVARQPERTREDARAAAGEEAERHRAVGAVQRLVVGAVAREDDDRVDLVRELGARARSRARAPA